MGLKLLDEMSTLEPPDQSIVEEFTKLHVQVEFLRIGHQHPCSILKATDPDFSLTKFESLREARLQMDYILDEIFHLTEKARRATPSSFESYSVILLGRQAHIKTHLDNWLTAYDASRCNLQAQIQILDRSLNTQVAIRDKNRIRPSPHLACHCWYHGSCSPLA